MGKSIFPMNDCPILGNYSSLQSNSAIHVIWLPPICPKSPLHKVDSAKASAVKAVLFCASISSSLLQFFALEVFVAPSWAGNAPCLYRASVRIKMSLCCGDGSGSCRPWACCACQRSKKKSRHNGEVELQPCRKWSGARGALRLYRSVLIYSK